MMKRAITLTLSAVFFLANASAFASEKQQSGKAAHAPDLARACAKECPASSNNDEVLKCIEEMEQKQGEAAFKKNHRACYDAHEKYEKQVGKQEAGETNEESEHS